MHPNDQYYNQVNLLGELLPANNQMRHRRSIHLENTPSNFYNSKNINFSRVEPVQYDTSTIKPAFDANKSQNGIVFDMLKPLFYLMRSIGIFPIVNNVQSNHYKATLQWFLYSGGIFLIIVGFLFYIKYKPNDNFQLAGTEGRFEEAVINYLFTVYAVPIIVPPIVWYESKKLAGVVNDWVYFEHIYQKITQKKLNLNLGNKPIILTVALPVLACATMIVTHVTMEHRLIEVIPFSYINTVIYLIGGYWFIQCDILGKVALLVADDFHTGLKVGHSVQVSDYRTLWMLLGKIIRDVANASGYTITFLCLYLFLIVTLTIYGLLSQIQEGLNRKDIGLTITAVFALCFLFFICDEAHYASNCVRVQFQKKLLLVELHEMSEEIQQEINMFIRATEMSPTDMNAVGFFEINRNLFKSLLATMVTYLVVLLQFQISLPEDSSLNTNTNKTTKFFNTTNSPK